MLPTLKLKQDANWVTEYNNACTMYISLSLLLYTAKTTVNICCIYIYITWLFIILHVCLIVSRE